jgi:hypothetical protein
VLPTFNLHDAEQRGSETGRIALWGFAMLKTVRERGMAGPCITLGLFLRETDRP